MASNYLKANASNVATKDLYKDMDITFERHPITDDITVKKDVDAVKRSLKNIVLTNHFERPFKPNFGANLRGLLFELADDITRMEIRNQISEALEMLETRVKIDQIYLNQSQPNTMNVNIHYGVIGSREPQELEVILQRVR